MNVLLTAINAKYIHSNLAVYSLQAYAREHGQYALIAEFTINHRVEEILNELYMRKPDVLCFSCYIWNIEYVKELSAEFHKLCPQTPIWLGGPEVSFETETFLKENPSVTGIIIGEGEEAFYRLCAYYDREGFMEEIDGIAWRRENGEICIQPQKKLLPLDEIPFCYQDLERFENRIIYYESGRGCPFSCTYCLSSVDKQLRLRSLELVYRELQYFLDQRAAQVKFVDRTFNCDHEHAMGIWKYIKDHDNGVTNFHFEISADLLNEQELKLLSQMRPGLVQFEIGVQTTNFETLREIRRSMSIGRLEDAVLQIHKGRNIHQHLDLIAGLPYENYDSFQKSFDEVYALKPQQLQLGFLKVLKGSFLYENAEEYRLVYRDKPPYEVMETRWISYGEMLRIKLVEEMLEIHYNSGQFVTTLAVLERIFESPFEMYLRLAAFYGENGVLHQKMTRLARSEVLLKFASGIDPDCRELYEETLLYDLYIRENVKKRPEWAKDLSVYRVWIQKSLQEKGYQSKYCHLEPFFYPVREIDVRQNLDYERLMKKADAPLWVLFDYENRDTWTKEADIMWIRSIRTDDTV